MAPSVSESPCVENDARVGQRASGFVRQLAQRSRLNGILSVSNQESAMIAESIGFVLRTLPAFLLAIALLVAALHRGRWSTPERFLSWFLLLPVGVTAL
jgi:hypothetical protein